MACDSGSIFGILLCLAVVVLAASDDKHGRFTVIHSPKYTRFLERADELETSDIPSVVASTLGLPLNHDLKWNGLAEGDVFRRPKASIILTVIDIPEKVLKIEQFQKSYVTRENDGALNVDAIIDSIEREDWKSAPLTVDFYVESSVFTLRTQSGIVAKLPSTIYSLQDNFVSDWFTQERLGSLNISLDSNVLLIGELFGIRHVVTALKENAKALKTQSPDFFHFTVSGLTQLSSTYGSESQQVKDAHHLIISFIQQLKDDFVQLYNGNAIVQVLAVTLASNEIGFRQRRSLLQDIEAGAVSNTQNATGFLAPKFTYQYSAMFNIILWVMIGFSLAIFGIAWGIWHMDPGRDSLIYRMTSQRIKKDA